MKFTKMHGLGNDFIIVESSELSQTNLTNAELAQKMCDRHFGIGADGLIIVNPTDVQAQTDMAWRIFNSDGTEPQMCGNGIRCFAKYVYEKGLIKKKNFSIWTLAGEIRPEILDNGQVKVDMGEPILESQKIPTTLEDIDCVINYPVEIEGEELFMNAVSMGNPHCILFTDENSAELAKNSGAKLENHAIFPEKTNVEFVNIISKTKIRVDVWERGCGITLACGTGACASVVAGVLNELTERKVEVELPGGNLFIEWQESTNKLFMTGNAEFVFEGELLI